MDRETIRKSAIVESQWKQRALRLAGGLEIPWRRWPEKLKPCEGVIAYDLGYNLDYCWDGKTLFVGDRNSSSIVHDIAHWLIAPKRRRNKPEFGLGSCPDAGALKLDPIVKREYAQTEEMSVSILGIAIEFHLGMDWRWTLIDHGWDVGGYRDDDLSHNDIGNLCVAIGHIAKLEQLGYLKDGRPVAIEAM